MTIKMLTFLVLVSGIASPALAIPGMGSSYWTHDLNTDAGLCACPAGDGQPFASMTSPSGDVDGTIHLFVLTDSNAPVYLFPYEDLWLQVPGLNACPNGAAADHATDLDGHTTFSVSPSFGGVQTGALTVMISGDAVPNPAPDAGFFHVTSPDLNGDRSVDLSDVILFSERWFAEGYDPGIDYLYDGVNDLSDIVVFASHMGHRCP